MRKGFDSRYFVAIDQGMPENVKVIDLSDAAFRAYIELICYSARVRSDGHLPAGAINRYASSVLELETAGLIEQDDTAWAIHDFLDHQRSAAERDAISDAKRTGGALGSHGRWHLARRIFDPTCEFCLVNGSTYSSPNGSPNKSGVGISREPEPEPEPEPTKELRTENT